MKKPRIFRKRFIPDEIVDISQDTCLLRDDDMLVTCWNTVKPRSDFAKGISFAFMKEGYKISRFYDRDGNFLYWYCDIIDVIYDSDSDTYTFIDLLVDIKVYADGTIRVLDVDELAEACEKGLITKDQVQNALKRLDILLKLIYGKKFPPEICNNRDFLNYQ